MVAWILPLPITLNPLIYFNYSICSEMSLCSHSKNWNLVDWVLSPILLHGNCYYFLLSHSIIVSYFTHVQCPAAWFSGNVFAYWSRDPGFDYRLLRGIFVWLIIIPRRVWARCFIVLCTFISWLFSKEVPGRDGHPVVSMIMHMLHRISCTPTPR